MRWLFRVELCRPRRRMSLGWFACTLRILRMRIIMMPALHMTESSISRGRTSSNDETCFFCFFFLCFVCFICVNELWCAMCIYIYMGDAMRADECNMDSWLAWSALTVCLRGWHPKQEMKIHELMTAVRPLEDTHGRPDKIANIRNHFLPLRRIFFFALRACVCVLALIKLFMPFVCIFHFDRFETPRCFFFSATSLPCYLCHAAMSARFFCCCRYSRQIYAEWMRTTVLRSRHDKSGVSMHIEYVWYGIIVMRN